MCCIRENPEPVIFKISCHGVRPELELDRRQLQFDRVLLHRFVRWISLTATAAIWKTFCYLWEGQKYLLFIHFNAPIMREKSTRERVKMNQKGPRIIKNGGRLRWINEEPLKDLTHLKRFDCTERFGDFENDSRETYLMSVFIFV